jgi:glucose/arabinose dehydrogenase
VINAVFWCAPKCHDTVADVIVDRASAAFYEDPVAVWSPTVAPSDAVIYEGELYPDWSGDLFFGAMRFGGRPNPDLRQTRVRSSALPWRRMARSRDRSICRPETSVSAMSTLDLTVPSTC